MMGLVRRAGALAAVAACTLGGLTGCGSSSTTQNDTAPVAGGTLYEGLVLVSSIDPALGRSVSDRVVADQLYDGLTTWNANSLATEPALASKWESSPAKNLWTFHLRPGAVAVNGEPITPGDVKASFEHLANPVTGSPNADLLSAVTGYGAYRANPAVGLAGITVSGDAVVFALDAPNGDFDALVGSPVFGVTHYNADGSTAATGPFVVTAPPSAAGITLAKAPGSKAIVDGANIVFYPDVAASYKDFVAGKLDWSLVPPEAATQAGQTYGSHLYKPSLRTLYLSINTKNSATIDPRYRQAILHAIDRTAVAAKLTGVDARVLNGVVPDGVPGSAGGACAAACAHDVAAAKALVAQVFPAGSPAPIAINVSGGAPFNNDAAQQIVSDLAAAGIPATVAGVAPEQFATITVDPNRMVFQTSWSAAYPRQSAFLTPLFFSTSPANVAAVQSADTDARLAAAEIEPDAEKRINDYRMVETQVVAGYAAVVPLASIYTDSVAKPTVRGLAPLPTGNFDASAVWLDAAH